MPKSPATDAPNRADTDAPPTDARSCTLLFLILAVAVPLAFVLITHNIWEDFLITFRHSKNFIDGRGLVFNPQRRERIQGFTSCLNVMLPAIFYAVLGHSEAAALNLYRAVCLAAYVGGGYALLKTILRDRASDKLSPLIFILLYVTEAKTVAYTMNGQESVLMAAFAALGLIAAYRGLGNSWKLSAISWTGLLYTRPDAAVYIAAISVAGLLFLNENPRAAVIGIVKSAVVAAILFLPWFIFVCVYYGQPIPHTVLAKSNFGMLDAVHPLNTIWATLKDYPNAASFIFLPVYYSFRGWPVVCDVFGLLCATICTIYWLIPSTDRLGRIASFIYTILALYLAFTNAFAILSPWYMPAPAVIGIVVLSRALMQLTRISPGLRIPARLLQTTIVAASTLLLIAQTYELKLQQSIVEDGMRKPLGLYLNRVVQPDQKVYSEALGYIGYYSDRYILDWPGLVTPEVVKLRREKRVGFVTILTDLMPEWLILRPAPEATAMEIQRLRDHYTVVKTFDASREMAEHQFLPGRGYLFVDATFIVLKRNDVVPATQP